MHDLDFDKVREFDCIAGNEIKNFIENVDEQEYRAAAELIIEAEGRKNRVHITGIGKPGHVSGYGASLLSSTGTPTYFLHGTEAVHGSCGQLIPGDIVICISNSGETSELKNTVRAIKNNGCSIIGISGNQDSWLAKESKVHIFAGVAKEGDPLNRAPRSSILVENYVIQRLSLILQIYKNIDSRQYVRWHPGGSLGILRDDEQ